MSVKENAHRVSGSVVGDAQRKQINLDSTGAFDSFLADLISFYRYLYLVCFYFPATGSADKDSD